MLGKKVSDFIKLEDGNIGRKAAVITGATLASSMLGMVLTAQNAQALCHDNVNFGYGCCQWHFQGDPPIPICTRQCHENHDHLFPCP